MQSTGQTSTHAVSFVPIQGSAITYAIVTLLRGISIAQKKQNTTYIGMESMGLYHQTSHCTSRFLLEKSISRPDWREPAARLGFLGSIALRVIKDEGCYAPQSLRNSMSN
jgi:hypothetical protein